MLESAGDAQQERVFEPVVQATGEGGHGTVEFCAGLGIAHPGVGDVGPDAEIARRAAGSLAAAVESERRTIRRGHARSAHGRIDALGNVFVGELDRFQYDHVIGDRIAGTTRTIGLRPSTMKATHQHRDTARGKPRSNY